MNNKLRRYGVFAVVHLHPITEEKDEKHDNLDLETMIVSR